MKRLTVMMMCVVIGAGAAKAVDEGDPVYKADLKGDTRVEFVYENFDRDIVVNLDEIAGPGGSIGIDESDETSTDSDLFMGRVSLLLSESGALFFDAGIVDEDIADDTPLIFGIGGRVLVVNDKTVQLSLFGNAHYVPSYDSTEQEGSVEITTEQEYYELTGGIMLSAKLPLDNSVTLVPYGGLALSMLDGDADVTYDFPNANVSTRANADIEEDDIVVGVLGASLLFSQNLSLRVEGRIIGDSSFSAALGAAF